MSRGLSRSIRRVYRWYFFNSRLIHTALAIILLIDFIWISFPPPPATRVAPRLYIRNEHGTGRKDRVFIAAMHWNDEQLLRSHWNHAVVDLARSLGPENVYISISESGSWDDTKGALRELDEELGKLGVARTIKLDNTTHIDEIARAPEVEEEGWIFTPRKKLELRRIPYLSRVRNEVMQVMRDLASRDEEPLHFDRVLWLNDVVFTVEDITTLLRTRDGAYAAACALDFGHPPRYYDTFAVRDDVGATTATQTWPYFRSARARAALRANAPVPVASCWTGAAAFDAAPFYAPRPLTFRGVPDSLARHRLEGSECCLIHADNPLSATEGVWLNPNVRVGYSPEAYEAVRADRGAPWPPSWERVSGRWANRLARLLARPRWFLEDRTVRSRVSAWRAEARGGEREERGTHCLINEMQVLTNDGWAHV